MMPPASEALYFNGEPVLHIVQWQERQREQRRLRLQREALRQRPQMFGPSRFAMLEAYWRDPEAFRPDEDRCRDEFNAAMAPHYARVRAEQEARWAREGEA